MANTDMTRVGGWVQKKTTSLFAGIVKEGSNQKDGEFPVNVDANFLLGTLPEDAIITNAYVHVKTASDDGTSCVAALGTAEGGTEILSAADLTATGKTGTFTGQSLTDTGVDVYLSLTWGGENATEVGEYYVVIEYDEVLKANGEFTQL